MKASYATMRTLVIVAMGVSSLAACPVCFFDPLRDPAGGAVVRGTITSGANGARLNGIQVSCGRVGSGVTSSEDGGSAADAGPQWDSNGVSSGDGTCNGDPCENGQYECPLWWMGPTPDQLAVLVTVTDPAGRFAQQRLTVDAKPRTAGAAQLEAQRDFVLEGAPAAARDGGLNL